MRCAAHPQLGPTGNLATLRLSATSADALAALHCRRRHWDGCEISSKSTRSGWGRSWRKLNGRQARRFYALVVLAGTGVAKRIAARPSSSQTRLVIAEKPMVMRMIAEAVGGLKQRPDKTGKLQYFEGDGLLLAAASGHLVNLQQVDWNSPLPIFPSPFKLEVSPASHLPKLNLIRELASRADILVNGCDAGREGELIFRRIIEFLGLESKPSERLWLQSLTPDAIRNAMQSCRPGSEFEPLAAAARLRQESDWLVGINATVALRRRSHIPNTTSTGRVQTPTLSMVTDREKHILKFKPEPYLLVHAAFSAAPGQKYEGTHSTLEQSGSLAPVNWEQLADTWEIGVVGKIVKDAHVDTTENPKPLHDLAELQRECSQRFKLTPQQTQGEAQKLYESGLVTYPRTDSRHLPKDYVKQVKDMLLASSATVGAASALPASLLQKAADGVSQVGTRVFNDSKVSDHFAIHPTEKGLATFLSSKESSVSQKVLGCIARRFVAAFLPASRFRTVRRTTSVDGHLFTTTMKDLVEPGYLEVEGKKAPSQTRALKALPAGTKVSLCKKLRIERLETQPPTRFTQATLLTAMEHCGRIVKDAELKRGLDTGLGTAATRGQIIEKLLTSKLLVPVDGKTASGFLKPTAQAIQLVDLLRGELDLQELALPELTGRWELDLRGIEHSKKKHQSLHSAFETSIRAFVLKIVERAQTCSPFGSALCRVGKHKGKTFEETLANDPVYCRWILSLGLEEAGPFAGFQVFLLENRKDLGAVEVPQAGPPFKSGKSRGKTLDIKVVADDPDYGDSVPQSGPEASGSVVPHVTKRQTKKGALAPQKPQGGNAKLKCGKHIGKTFKKVLADDPQYCDWVLGLKSQAGVEEGTRFSGFQTFLSERKADPQGLDAQPTGQVRSKIKKCPALAADAPKKSGLSKNGPGRPKNGSKDASKLALSAKNIPSLSKATLKEELFSRGLAVSGGITELQNRLFTALSLAARKPHEMRSTSRTQSRFCGEKPPRSLRSRSGSRS
ncbi:unnamed protein product [Polarella glacialis]|uniref:DNA topoisomerase n=1 Tax=Polarella glacialis TaxID=89957 RepID=A0A813GJ26_POLGL|nr:unnamed protein product [Polarella glacialis]CAE8622655.1 unnamed protein product [Polarella glacialis]